MREYRDNWEPVDEKPTMTFGFGFTPAVKGLLIAEVAIFILAALANKMSQTRGWHILSYGWQLEHLGLSTGGIFQGFELWQFLTYQFMHSMDGIFHILFNMLILFIFGPLCEKRYGARKFLLLFLISGITGGMAFIITHAITGSSVPVVGASGAILGVAIAAAVLHPDLKILFMFLFPMRLRTLAIIIVLSDIIMMVWGENTGTAYSAHLGGCLCGFLFARGESRVSLWFQRMKKRSALEEKRSSARTRARVDELLGKIHEEGIESLSKKERRFLEKASQKYNEP